MNDAIVGVSGDILGHSHSTIRGKVGRVSCSLRKVVLGYSKYPECMCLRYFQKSVYSDLHTTSGKKYSGTLSGRVRLLTSFWKNEGIAFKRVSAVRGAPFATQILGTGEGTLLTYKKQDFWSWGALENWEEHQRHAKGGLELSVPGHDFAPERNCPLRPRLWLQQLPLKTADKTTTTKRTHSQMRRPAATQPPEKNSIHRICPEPHRVLLKTQ